MTINSSQKEYANLHTFLTFDEQTHNVRLSYLLILFIKSYKKQTEYVKKQVEKYMNEHSSSQ